jgi:hypothetical protein
LLPSDSGAPARGVHRLWVFLWFLGFGLFFCWGVFGFRFALGHRLRLRLRFDDRRSHGVDDLGRFFVPGFIGVVERDLPFLFERFPTVRVFEPGTRLVQLDDFVGGQVAVNEQRALLNEGLPARTVTGWQEGLGDVGALD